MVDVLVLNGSYEPHQIMKLRKAMKLLVKNRAEVVKARHGDMHSVHASMPKPSVIKLHQFIKYFQAPVAFSKKAVLVRDKHTCQYCGRKDGKMTIDHIHPQSLGGKNTWENCVACCQRCNSDKANKTLEETGMKLLKQPRRPSKLLFMRASSQNPEWEEFLFL